MEARKNYTEVQTWKIGDLVDSFSDAPAKKNKIAVPKYQRSLVWRDVQKRNLIRSLRSGFPIGAILLYKTTSDETGNTLYNLVDGLQRTSTLREYSQRPPKFFERDWVPDSLREEISNFFGSSSELSEIDKIVADWVSELEGFEEVHRFSSWNLAKMLRERLPSNSLPHDRFELLVDKLSPHLQSLKTEHDLSQIQVPVIIYSGSPSNLPTIFERLNREGTRLNKYQIFAATWTQNGAVKIPNEAIRGYIKSKYQQLIEQGYDVEGFDPESNAATEFNAFEYFFGLGKYLSSRYESLFGNDGQEDQTESIGFNLSVACLGLRFDQMDELPGKLKTLDQSQFESCLRWSADFVSAKLKPYILLKVNKRNKNPLYHTELQIVSLVAKVFRTRFDADLNVLLDSEERLRKLAKNVSHYYLYDIITQHWRGSGDSKAIEYIGSDRYFEPITEQSWNNILDEWFLRELQKRERIRMRISDESVFFFHIFLDIRLQQ
jgi:hypothetical protein